MTPIPKNMIKMLELELSHYDLFGVIPYIIGYYRNDIEKLIESIIEAIETNKPYNEYELLTDEEKKAFDDGELLF